MFNQEKKYYLKAFLTALIMAAVLLLPFVIIDGGYFVYYGDYNAQQIPFYKTCINAVQSGNFGWNWQTDLGVNFVGSYSFYTLGSPFFWLAALFPASISQYLMAPLLALKIALSSLFAFMYIRRFVTKPQTALIGGLLYAFSGFSLYNIFFNHFHEAIVFFPLLLIGLEEAVVNKRRGMFALTVALNAFVNYFFFIGECIFLVLYFVVRLCMDKGFRIKLADFFCLAFESVAGVMLAGILFVPSIYQVLDVPRSTQILNGWNFVFYGTQQRYGLILESLFFPPEVPARNEMFSEANAKWSSVALYLPLFSMAGVIAFVKGAKGHWARVLLPICLFMALVPGLNAAFVLFNNNFYTRWFYMPELICCLATVYTLEHEELDLKLGLKACAVAVGAMAALALLSPFTKVSDVEREEGVIETVKRILPRFLVEMSPAVYVIIALSIGFLVALYFVIKQRKHFSAEDFMERVTTVTIICSMILGYYVVGYGRILGPYIHDYNKTVSAEVRIDDIDFYRMEALDEMNNVNMLWNMSSLKSFTSIIPSSTFELYELLDIERSVNSAPEESHYALRVLTRVKYVFVPNDMDEEKREEALGNLAIYEYMETQGDYDVYKTDYALPMGFAYDTYVPESKAKKNGSVDKLMVRSVILSDEQIEEYSDILTALPEEEIKVTTIDRFKEDAQQRIDEGVLQFGVSSRGFSAISSYEEEKLVMFSVPFDKGWSAAIGGEPVEIDKVNGGFMAIRVPAGISEIEFTYRTPGLTLGIVLTIAGALLIAVYIAYFKLIKRTRVNAYAHLYAQNQVEGVKAHSSYIAQLSKQIYNCPEKRSNKQASKDSSENLLWPDNGEIFTVRTRQEPSEIREPKRTSHIMEGDEAYKVLEELDEKKRRESDDDIIE